MRKIGAFVRRRLRPLDLLFLLSLAAGTVIYAVLHGPPRSPWLLPPPLFVAGTAALVAGWFLLSWERSTRVPVRLVSVLFALLAWIATFDVFGAGAVCALATANLVFVWGTVPAALFAVGMAAGNIALTAVSRPIEVVDVGLALYVVILYGVVTVISEILRRAREDKRRTESLLTQLGELYVGNMVDTYYSLVAGVAKEHIGDRGD